MKIYTRPWGTYHEIHEGSFADVLASGAVDLSKNLQVLRTDKGIAVVKGELPGMPGVYAVHDTILFTGFDYEDNTGALYELRHQGQHHAFYRSMPEYSKYRAPSEEWHIPYGHINIFPTLDALAGDDTPLLYDTHRDALYMQNPGLLEQILGKSHAESLMVLSKRNNDYMQLEHGALLFSLLSYADKNDIDWSRLTLAHDVLEHIESQQINGRGPAYEIIGESYITHTYIDGKYAKGGLIVRSPYSLNGSISSRFQSSVSEEINTGTLFIPMTPDALGHIDRGYPWHDAFIDDRPALLYSNRDGIDRWIVMRDSVHEEHMRTLTQNIRDWDHNMSEKYDSLYYGTRNLIIFGIAYSILIAAIDAIF